MNPARAERDTNDAPPVDGLASERFEMPGGYAPGLAQRLAGLLPRAAFPREYYAREVRRRSKMRVVAGPFAGMRYVDAAVGSVYLAKLVGVYEKELWPVVEAACALSPGLVIDVGTAEGYYAVGLARRLPDARVIGFDGDADGRKLLAEMATLNDVADRVSIRGLCEPVDLNAALGERVAGRPTLVISDCEGYERTLLDPAAVPALRDCHVLVELHDFLIPNVSDEIRRRFAGTHAIETITQQPASADDYPFRSIYRALTPSAYVVRAIGDFRPAVMSWFWMKPMQRSA